MAAPVDSHYVRKIQVSQTHCLLQIYKPTTIVVKKNRKNFIVQEHIYQRGSSSIMFIPYFYVKAKSVVFALNTKTCRVILMEL